MSVQQYCNWILWMKMLTKFEKILKKKYSHWLSPSLFWLRSLPVLHVLLVSSTPNSNSGVIFTDFCFSAMTDDKLVSWISTTEQENRSNLQDWEAKKSDMIDCCCKRTVSEPYAIRRTLCSLNYWHFFENKAYRCNWLLKRLYSSSTKIQGWI